MIPPNFMIFLVMLLSGTLGGVLNYLSAQGEEPKNTGFWQSLLGGIVASFMVPLFLNMISSNLIETVKGTANNAGDLTKLFVLAGFCLVAGVSSRAFITTLSARVLREAKATRNEVQQMKREFEPIREKEIENEPQEMIVPLSASVADDMSIEEDAKKALKALASGRFTLRTRTGIANETGLEKDVVNKILDDLVEMRLVRKVKVMVQGELKTRWYLSEKGRALSSAAQKA
jgi:hypothetical protein